MGKYGIWDWFHDWYIAPFPYIVYICIMMGIWLLILITVKPEIHIVLVSIVILSFLTFVPLFLILRYQDKKKAKEQLEIQKIEDDILRKKMKNK